MNKVTPYPLLLRPVIKDYLWGGRRLIDEYGFECDTDIAAEAWMLACHKDGTNTVVNGALKGELLIRVLSMWGYEAERFELLIKLIDAQDKLSVQVHPEDEYAYSAEGEPGKTEMWYVVDCKEGARLIYGFTRELDQAEFEQRIRDNTLDEVMNYVPVHKGDVFFIAAGTLHAIGEGILIAEIQQNSNTTYRVSDYGRLGADGKPRQLHIDKALAVTHTTPPVIPYGDVGQRIGTRYGSRRPLAHCEYFTVDQVELSGEMSVEAPQAFISLLMLEGDAIVTYQDGEIALAKGDSLFIPKNVAVTLHGKAEMILSSPTTKA